MFLYFMCLFFIIFFPFQLLRPRLPVPPRAWPHPAVPHVQPKVLRRMAPQVLVASAHARAGLDEGGQRVRKVPRHGREELPLLGLQVWRNSKLFVGFFWKWKCVVKIFFSVFASVFCKKKYWYTLYQPWTKAQDKHINLSACFSLKVLFVVNCQLRVYVLGVSWSLRPASPPPLSSPSQTKGLRQTSQTTRRGTTDQGTQKETPRFPLRKFL